MAKPKTQKGVDEIVAERRQEIETTIEEMADKIEQYFLITPFDFVEGTEGEGTYHLFADVKKKNPFNRFYPWIDNWMCALFPLAYESQVKLEQSDHPDETGELAYSSVRFGFVLGAMVGMKNMGASKEELLRRAQGFILQDLEHVRYRAEADAKKVVKGVNRGN